jgi:hypothetical protein
MGNPNRRARRNAKIRESKRLEDEPQTGSERNESQQTTGSLSGTERVAAARIDPARSAHAKEELSSHRTQQCKDRMRMIKAMWRGIAWVFISVVSFLDKYNGAVTAVATIVIGILTYEYVTYSKRQWETMTQQLGQMQVEQRPWLIIKRGGFDFHVGQPFCVPITLVNSGKNPATHITGYVSLRAMPFTSPIDFTPFNQKPRPGSVVIKFYTGVLFPGDPFEVKDTFCVMEESGRNSQRQVWSQELQTKLAQGMVYVDFHGEFRYQDAGRPHWTRFCLPMSTSLPPAVNSSCTEYESVDEDK